MAGPPRAAHAEGVTQARVPARSAGAGRQRRGRRGGAGGGTDRPVRARARTPHCRQSQAQREPARAPAERDAQRRAQPDA